jgi:hypothetical protein
MLFDETFLTMQTNTNIDMPSPVVKLSILKQIIKTIK